MNDICLHLPDYLYESASRLAESENLSINQLITLVLAEKVSLLRTEEERTVWTQQTHMDEIAAVLSRAGLTPPEESE